MDNTTLRTPISEKGISAEMFDAYLGDFVTTKLTSKEVKQVGKVNGIEYKLMIRLTRWTGRTTPAQIVVLSRLFWANYPKMYERFGAAGESPTEITLDIENKGYGIAWNMGKLVHLHDGWLEKCPEDFDCITHELAHAIQNGWEGERLEHDSFIERFADACRYLYAFEDGKYNDLHWQMQTVKREPTRADSVRFLVWFDYFYSTKENDLLLKYFRVCKEGRYPKADWKSAWAEIFAGSALDGRDIEEIYAEFAASEFALLETGKKEGVSPLLSVFDVRKNTR
jgi:hypothetical protein